MDHCPNCGVATRPGDQFCLNCGNRLAPAQPGAAAWGAPPGVNQGPGNPEPVWFGGPPQAPAPQMPLPNSPTLPTVQVPAVENNGGRASGATEPGTQPTMATVSAPPQQEPSFATQLAEEDRTVPAPPPAPVPAAPPVSAAPPAPAGSGGFETHMAVEDSEETISTISVAPAKLIVTRNGQAREFVLKKPEISIGRAPSNEVPLSGDQLASRRHALIRYDGVNFTLRDVGSANGTYVNGVELRTPTVLRNGDHISVGEHEVVFFTGAANEEEEPVTVTNALAPQPQDPTFATSNISAMNEPPEMLEDDTNRMAESGIAVPEPTGDEDETRQAGLEHVGIGLPPTDEAEPGALAASLLPTQMVPDEVAVPETMKRPPLPLPGMEEQPTEAPVPPGASLPPNTIIVSKHVIDANTPVQVTDEAQAEDDVQEEPRAIGIVEPPPQVVEEDIPLPVPQLPEITPIMSAIQSLDKQTAEMRDHLLKAKALEEQAQQLRDQLKTASDQLSSHDNSVAQLAQSLRVGVANVSTRLKQVVEEVSRAEESLSVSELMRLIEDVRNDPHDIYTLGSLARRARELAQFFELHQRVNQILSGCLTTLNELMAIDASKAEG